MRWILRPRFRLLTLLTLVTALCVWLGVITHRAHRQRDAIASLSSSDAVFIFDYQMDAAGINFDERAPAPGPAWLRRLLGDGYFRNVVQVWLPPGKIPINFELLTAFPKLRSVHLKRTNITDADLAGLANLRALESLDLRGTGIQGSGLRELQSLPRLSELDLDGTQVDDRGLSVLSDLPHIRRLVIGSPNVTPTGWRQLGKLRSLEILLLRGSPIDAEGVEALHGLANLRKLAVKLAKGEDPAAIRARLKKALPGCKVYFGDEYLNR